DRLVVAPVAPHDLEPDRDRLVGLVGDDDALADLLVARGLDLLGGDRLGLRLGGATLLELGAVAAAGSGLALALLGALLGRAGPTRAALGDRDGAAGRAALLGRLGCDGLGGRGLGGRRGGSGLLRRGNGLLGSRL